MSDTWNEAVDGLAAMRRGRASVVTACECPPSRHLAFAAVVGGYVAIPAVPLGPRLVALAVLSCAILLIVRWDRRRTGMFVNGYRAGRTRKVTLLLLAMILPAYLLGSWLSDEHGTWWPSLVMGAVAVPLGYAFSRRWARVFRDEMLGA